MWGMNSTAIQDIRQTEDQRGHLAWIVALIPNALAILFGSSYIWWPSEFVLAHNGTEGILTVGRFTWGAFVMASGIVMVVLLVTAFRQGKQWAWYAAWYDIVFFLAVALIEPDYVFPVIFSVVVAAAFIWARPSFGFGREIPVAE